MNIPRQVCLSIVFGFIIAGTVFGVQITTCKTCGPNYVACVNETGYKHCPDGKTPSKQEGVCPKGKVCTDQQQICQPKDTAKKVCGNCETCISGFMCLSKNQFEYCQGKMRTRIVGKCPEGQYCSIANVVKNHDICVESCLDEPTCYAEEISTTPAPTIEDSYSKSCVGTTVSGNYENLDDLSGRTYVFCEIIDGVMNSVLLHCKSGYFSANQNKCVDK